MKWALIVGAKGSGKTTTVRAVVDAARARGLAVGGVVQEPVTEAGSTERVAYDAVRLATPEERVTVARRGPVPGPGGDPMICSFSFDDAAFARVRGWIDVDASDVDVVVIDEVSKAESRGRGHAAAIVDALRTSATVVLAVRDDELVHVMTQFGLGEPLATLSTADPSALHAFVAALVAARE